MDPKLAAQEAEEARVARETLAARLQDCRALLHRPEFQRWVKHWIGEAGTFGVVKIFTAESYWLGGRRELGTQIWNELVAADPAKMVEMLTLTTDTEPDPQ